MHEQISVIIPTIGRVDSLSICLASLSKQSILPGEIIVVDNSFSGNIAKLIEYPPKLRINYIRESKKGVAFARNAGIRASKYDLVAFIDDDCVAGKNWIKQILRSLPKKQRLIIQGRSINALSKNIYAGVEQFSTDLFFQSKFYADNGIIKTQYLDTKNCAFRKSSLPNSLKFDIQFTYILEDVDFSLRAVREGVDIVRNSEMKVWHYRRTNLFSHLKREFAKGRVYFRFQNKWEKGAWALKHPEISNILVGLQRKKIIAIEKKLKKETLRKKAILFKIFFYLFLFVDRLFVKLGYFAEKFSNTKH